MIDIKKVREGQGLTSFDEVFDFMNRLAIKLDARAFERDPKNELPVSAPNKIMAFLLMDLAMAIRHALVDRIDEDRARQISEDRARQIGEGQPRVVRPPSSEL